MRSTRFWVCFLALTAAIGCDGDDDGNGNGNGNGNGDAGREAGAEGGGTDGMDVAGPDTVVDAAAEASAPAPVMVRATEHRFEPMTIAIPVGGTVRWTNVGVSVHTVTSGQGSTAAGAGTEFDAQLNPGATFERTFTTTGSHPYFCRPHESLGMRGTVTVTP